MAVEIADTLDRMGGNGTYPLIKSEDASYSNVNKTSVNNVKDALDELYNKESGVQLYIYKSVAQACTYIPKSQRKLGRTILIGKNVGTEEEPEYINVQEFWWGNGIEDDDLIVKTNLIVLDDTNITATMADYDSINLPIEIGQKFIWKGSYQYWDTGVPHSLVTNGIYIYIYDEINECDDYKLIFCLTTPYISEPSTAGNIFPREVRYIGMNVNVAGEEYWFKDGIEDKDLVVKSGSTSKIIHVVDDNDIEDFWFDYETEEGKIEDDMASRIKNLKTGDLFMWNSPNSRFYYVHMYPSDMSCELVPYCVYKILDPEDYKTNKIKLIGSISQITAEDIPYDGSSLNEKITNVDTALTFSLTKSSTITNPEEVIPLTTKITNIIIDTEYQFEDDNEVILNFSYSGQNECTIVIYNQTGNSIRLPTNFSNIGNYEVISVNGISSVTLLNNSSCEINMLFTNNECRMLILV